MARDSDALLVRKWAAASTVVATPESAGLDRAQGFPAAYSEDMARTLAVWQQQMREATALFEEIGERGILEWDAAQSFEHPAWTGGSDGELYRSVQSSGGSSPAQNPVTDTNDVYWRRFEVSVPTSTTGRRGTIELATAAEARNGEDDQRAVTAAGARSAIDIAANAAIEAAIAALPSPLWV